jgi:hypothetical protein
MMKSETRAVALTAALSDARGLFRKLRGHGKVRTIWVRTESQVRQRYRCRMQGRVESQWWRLNPAAFNNERDIAVGLLSGGALQPMKRGLLNCRDAWHQE